MKLKDLFEKLLLRIFLTFIYIINNEITILIAAVTYYAMLSFVPLLLVLSVIMQKVLIAYPGATDVVKKFILDLNLDFMKNINIIDVILSGHALGFGLFGLISIFFTSTLFLRTINKVFKKIFLIKELKESLLHMCMPFLLYVLFLLLILIMIFLKISLVFIEKYLVFKLKINFSLIMGLIERFYIMPVIIFFILVFISYYLLSMRRLRFFDSFKVAFYFMVSLYVANIMFKHFYNVSFYNAIYGALSSIVITLAYVYIFFLIFIFWAQFGFVDTNFKLVVIKVFFEEAFKNPHSFLVRYLSRLLDKNVVRLNKGEMVKLDEFIGLIVIVMDGSLELTSENGLPVYIDRFSFFNVVDISENVLITASEESLLLIITKEQKEFLMTDSPVASAIFLSNEKILMM